MYLSGSERVTSQFEAGSMMTMTYWSGNSISVDGTSVSTARWIVHSSGGMLWGELDS